MKKRLITVLLAALMIVSMIPLTCITSSAGTESVLVGGVEMTDDTYLAVGASSTVTQKPEGGYAYYKDGVLTLHNYTYTGAENQYVIEANRSLFTIRVEGENLLEAAGKTGCSVYARGDRLTFEEGEEPGKLTMCGGAYGVFFNGNSDSQMHFNSGAYAVFDTTVVAIYGAVHCYMNVWAGSIEIDTDIVNSQGMYAVSGLVAIHGGDVSISTDSSCLVGSRVAINGGKVQLRSVKSCFSGSVSIEGGYLDAAATVGTVLAYTGMPGINSNLTAFAAVGYEDALGAYVAENCKTYQRLVVQPKTVTKGDINNDGTVDLNDGTALFYHVNGMAVIAGDTLAADLNGDGKVELADATALFYSLNGLTAEE